MKHRETDVADHGPRVSALVEELFELAAAKVGELAEDASDRTLVLNKHSAVIQIVLTAIEYRIGGLRHASEVDHVGTLWAAVAAALAGFITTPRELQVDICDFYQSAHNMAHLVEAAREAREEAAEASGDLRGMACKGQA